MQYEGYAFSVNGKPTITQNANGAPTPWNRHITQNDYDQINAMYCGGVRGDGTPGSGGPSCRDQNQDCEFWASIGECSINPGKNSFTLSFYYVIIIIISFYDI